MCFKGTRNGARHLHKSLLLPIRHPVMSTFNSYALATWQLRTLTAIPSAGSTPFECCNQPVCDHLPTACRQKWDAAGLEGCL
jgi:hypothetical protein